MCNRAQPDDRLARLGIGRSVRRANEPIAATTTVGHFLTPARSRRFERFHRAGGRTRRRGVSLQNEPSRHAPDRITYYRSISYSVPSRWTPDSASGSPRSRFPKASRRAGLCAKRTQRSGRESQFLAEEGLRTHEIETDPCKRRKPCHPKMLHFPPKPHRLHRRTCGREAAIRSPEAGRPLCIRRIEAIDPGARRRYDIRRYTMTPETGIAPRGD
jgi:hypothetical protein